LAGSNVAGHGKINRASQVLAIIAGDRELAAVINK
jgi:hypothetical protein